jgi:hypothetical protein
MSIQTFTAYVAGLTNATSVVGADEPVINQSGTVKAVTNTVHRAYLDGYYGVQGRKVGLRISYVSSDVLSVGVGACEVNDGTDSWWVEKTSATAINSGTTNFPGAGAWAFVAIKADGTIALYAATGTAAQRPTNNLFQLTGGSIGYDDIGKHGYYYDADERVIGAIHKVSATSWYIINCQNEMDEIGINSAGKWSRINNKIKIIIGITTPTANANTNYTLPTALKTFVATAGIGECGIASNYYPSSSAATLYAWLTNATTMSYYTNVVQPCYFVIDGDWY